MRRGLILIIMVILLSSFAYAFEIRDTIAGAGALSSGGAGTIISGMVINTSLENIYLYGYTDNHDSSATYGFVVIDNWEGTKIADCAINPANDICIFNNSILLDERKHYIQFHNNLSSYSTTWSENLAEMQPDGGYGNDTTIYFIGDVQNGVEDARRRIESIQYYVDAGVSAPVVAINDANLTYRNNTLIGTSFNEDDEFFIYINATTDSEVDSSLSCYFTVGFIEAHFDNYPSGNLTATSSTPLFNGSIVDYESIINVIQEDVKFRLCRTGSVKKAVDFYINDAKYGETINKNIIPLCSRGFYEYNNITTGTFTPTNEVNVSVVCPTCTVSNGIRLISVDNRSGLWSRQFNYHNETLTFNSSNNLYEKRLIHSFDSGINQINFTCNDSEVISVNYVVGDVIPKSSFLEIDYNDIMINFNNNETITESSDLTIITGSCFGDIISFRQLNVTWNNDTLIKSVDNQIINLSKSDLSEDNLFKAILYCRDDEGNFSSVTQTFFQNDTTNPSISSYFPIDEDVIFYTLGDANIPVWINVTATDLNLYSITVNISYNSNSTSVYGAVVKPINTTSFSFNNQINLVSANNKYDYIRRIADAHTTNEIGIYDTIKDLVDKEVKIIDSNNNVGINIKLTSSYKVDAINVIKLKDRYTWTYDFSSSLNEVVRKPYRFFAGSSKNLTPVYNSDYGCHFVVGKPESHFLDFDLPDCSDADYSVSLMDGNYYCDIVTTCNKLDFNSFGELNIVTETTTFDTEASAVVSTSVNMTCAFNPAPTIRLGIDNKIEWSCSLDKLNSSEDFECVTELYDAYNKSYLIQVNPSYDDFKSKTTLISGGLENSKVNDFFDEQYGQAIVYFDGGILNELKPTKMVEGHVVCKSQTQTTNFIANMTPRYADYNDENIFRSAIIMNNRNIIIALVMLLIATGAVFVLIKSFWKNE